MISLPTISNEPNGKLRHTHCEKFNYLNILPDTVFDNITFLAKHICNATVAIIDLFDGNKNVIKSHSGLAFDGFEQELEFICLWNSDPSQTVLVKSEYKNSRLTKSTLLSIYGLKCIGTIPLSDTTGTRLGTLTVCDVQQKLLTPDQKNALSHLSKQIVGLFEERFRNSELQQTKASLEKRNKGLEQFAGMVSHDLKTPLGQIVQLIELLENHLDDTTNGEWLEYIKHLKTSSVSLGNYIDEMLTSYKKDYRKETIDVIELIESLQSMFKKDKTISIHFRSGVNSIIAQKMALKQILVNLISNAIKHNDKNRPIINVTLENNTDHYVFRIQDNGPGIPEASLKTLLESPVSDTRNGQNHNIQSGMGLTIFRRLVLDMGGEIKVTSKTGHGSTFSFTIPKKVCIAPIK